VKLLTLLLFAVIAIPTFSQDSEQYRTCTDKAHTQMELNSCASKESARVDAELNAAYQELLSKAEDEQGAVGKIKTCEKAWLVYRDSYIDAMYPAADKQTEYGTEYPAKVDLLRAKFTQQQITAVRELLQQYGPASR